MSPASRWLPSAIKVLGWLLAANYEIRQCSKVYGPNRRGSYIPLLVLYFFAFNWCPLKEITVTQFNLNNNVNFAIKVQHLQYICTSGFRTLSKKKLTHTNNDKFILYALTLNFSLVLSITFDSDSSGFSSRVTEIFFLWPPRSTSTVTWVQK